MKCTQYFIHTRRRPDRAVIRDEWIERVIHHPLRENRDYAEGAAAAFPDAEYDPVVDCTNYLFHRHTAEFSPAFRPGAGRVLSWLLDRAEYEPVVLTNSLGDKVRRHLGALSLGGEIAVLGDTRQYDMEPQWDHWFCHPELGPIQVWPLSKERQIDLRRPAYYRALVGAACPADGLSRRLVVVADTLSLPGALPLMMGIPFFLLRTPYTPAWCVQAVDAHPLGYVLEALEALPAALGDLPEWPSLNPPRKPGGRQSQRSGHVSI